MNGISGEGDDLRHELGEMELGLISGDGDRARLGLRRYLFGIADQPVEGSSSDAVAAVVGLRPAAPPRRPLYSGRLAQAF